MTNRTLLEDDINFIDYLKIIFNYKKTVLFFTIIGFLVTVCYLVYFMPPPKYTAQTVFFLKTSTPAASSSLGGVSSYLKVLGVSGGNNADSFVVAFLYSNKMQTLVQNDLQKYLQKHHLALNGKTEYLPNKGGTFILKYTHQDPVLSYLVIKSYLKNLKLLNQKFELSAQKKLFEILDPVEIPQLPVQQSKILILLLGLLASNLSGIIFVLIFNYFYQAFSNQKENV
jgi:LPS O-antigen subunit length determinant protein (WzzB/FepE family)